ncbi:carnitine O-acetyltransferase-like [Convolutriloba macropyga]|uniref:carnitine O-acetyltransferase-like n=1 Tax=Convolutriloba macropyga TaxID=536237 RepID=UPI003F5238D4
MLSVTTKSLGPTLNRMKLVSIAERSVSGKYGTSMVANLVEPATDLNDEGKILEFLPHVAKYQNDMFDKKNAPVPSLDKTLDKYITTLEPILDPDQMKKAKQVITDMRSDPVIAKCQQYIEEKASNSPNWLAEWWLNAAYLGFRESVVINVSPALVAELPPFNSVHSWIKCAASIVCGQVKAIEKIKSEGFVDSVRKTAQKSPSGPCLIQYYRLFNSCRVPQEGTDGYVVYPTGAPHGPRHIVVMCQNKLYSVDILDSDMNLLSADEIFSRLMGVYMSSCLPPSTDRKDSSSVPIGLLTSQHRDVWTKQYQQLISDNHNREVLEVIQSSIFVLCLDYDQVPSDSVGNSGDVTMEKRRERVSELSRIALHGGGSKKHSSNRWFDKTMQVILSSSGTFGMTQEHTTAEAVVPTEMQDSALRHYKKSQQSKSSVLVSDEALEMQEYNQGAVTPLVFNTDVIPDIEDAIQTAQQQLDKMVDSLDLNVCIFDTFGKSVIKQFGISPDAFFQVALQLAMFRYLMDKYDTSVDHQLLVPTYESGSLRNFRWGRTDTIRSATPQALAMSRAISKSELYLQDPKLPGLVRNAISAHSRYTREVMGMGGVDRHLMGLKLAYNEMVKQEPKLPLPQLFNEDFHAYFSEILLSTSQVPSDYDAFVSFGPTSLDCTGVCYNIKSNAILFMVSTFHASQRTDSKLFMEYVENALNTLRAILENELPSEEPKLSKSKL